MATASVKKICNLCGKDPAETAWIGDGKGGGWCGPCSIKLQAQWKKAGGKPAMVRRSFPPPPLRSAPPKVAAPQVATVPAKSNPNDKTGVPIAAPPPQRSLPPIFMEEDYSNRNEEPAPLAFSETAPAVSTPTAAPKLPSKCPACGTAVLTNSIICMRCRRDLTKMDKLLAIQAQGNKAPDAAEQWAEVVSKLMRGVLILGILGVTGFFGYVGYLWFFDHSTPFPPTRAEAVRAFLMDIATGTDRSYDQAFFATSIRARVTNNPEEMNFYKKHFAKIHNAFNAKYGADWINEIKIDPVGEQDPLIGDDYVLLTVKIQNDEYHVSTQVQMETIKLMEYLHDRKEFSEDGKFHFGVIQIEEYPEDWRYHPPARK